MDQEIQTEMNGEVFSKLLADLHEQTKILLRNNKSLTSNTNNTHLENDIPNGVPKKDGKSINGIRANWCVKCNRETFNSLCTHSPRSKSNRSSHSQQSMSARVKTIENNERLNIMNGMNQKPAIRQKILFEEKIDHYDTENKLNENNAVSDKVDIFQLKLRNAQFVESVAYWYNLECELEELPPVKRKKLDEHYIRLFGRDHAIDYFFLNDDQKSIACRKRIAKYVVIELTNYYNKKMITSKELFKMMAKHITSLLLSRSLFPGKLLL